MFLFEPTDGTPEKLGKGLAIIFSVLLYVGIIVMMIAHLIETM
jgi:hypothetical protein